MKIWLVRHGEAMDDVRDEYGGWHDPELSPKGLLGAEVTAETLKSKGIEVELILSSPLKRARQTADIIAKKFGMVVEEVVYLKERNSYGLLCGLNKKEAKGKYPELVAAYDEGRPVLGYEEYEFFVERVRELIKYLGKLDKNVLAVSHGKVMTTILTELIGNKPKTLGDNCVMETELVDGKLTLIKTEGIEF